METVRVMLAIVRILMRDAAPVWPCGGTFDPDGGQCKSPQADQRLRECGGCQYETRCRFTYEQFREWQIVHTTLIEMTQCPVCGAELDTVRGPCPQRANH